MIYPHLFKYAPIYFYICAHIIFFKCTYLFRIPLYKFYRITRDMMNSYVDLDLPHMYSTICVHNNIMHNIGGVEQSSGGVSNKVIKIT